MPIGLYARSDDPISRRAVVTVRAADTTPLYARLRGFHDASDRFIKRIAAAEGDHVCAKDDRLSINGAVIARRKKRDSTGRRLPSWSGCRTLSRDGVLLLGDGEDSFDGRYWGPIAKTKSRVSGRRSGDGAREPRSSPRRFRAFPGRSGPPQ